MLPVPRCGRRNDDNKYATTTTKTGKLQGRQREKQREIERESGSRRATAFGATPNSLYTLRARLTGISTASWCKKFLHSRTLNHLQTGSNHLPGQHPPTDTASPHPRPLAPLLHNFCLQTFACLYIVRGKLLSQRRQRQVGGRRRRRQLLLCLHCPQRTHSRTLSLSPPPRHLTLPSHKVQRVAPKVAKFSPFFSLPGAA